MTGSWLCSTAKFDDNVGWARLVSNLYCLEGCEDCGNVISVGWPIGAFCWRVNSPSVVGIVKTLCVNGNVELEENDAAVAAESVDDTTG